MLLIKEPWTLCSDSNISSQEVQAFLISGGCLEQGIKTKGVNLNLLLHFSSHTSSPAVMHTASQHLNISAVSKQEKLSDFLGYFCNYFSRNSLTSECTDSPTSCSVSLIHTLQKHRRYLWPFF